MTVSRTFYAQKLAQLFDDKFRSQSACVLEIGRCAFPVTAVAVPTLDPGLQHGQQQMWHGVNRKAGAWHGGYGAQDLKEDLQRLGLKSSGTLCHCTCEPLQEEEPHPEDPGVVDGDYRLGGLVVDLLKLWAALRGTWSWTGLGQRRTFRTQLCQADAMWPIKDQAGRHDVDGRKFLGKVGQKFQRRKTHLHWRDVAQVTRAVDVASAAIVAVVVARRVHEPKQRMDTLNRGGRKHGRVFVAQKGGENAKDLRQAVVGVYSLEGDTLGNSDGHYKRENGTPAGFDAAGVRVYQAAYCGQQLERRSV